MFGYEPAELIGKSGHAMLHHSKPDGTPLAIDDCPIRQTLIDGIARHVSEDVFWRKDGSPLPVEYEFAPVKEGDRIVGGVLTVKDISTRQRAEKALREQQAVLVALMKLPALQEGDLEKTLREMTEAAASTLAVERVSVWRFISDQAKIRCIDLYERSARRHSDSHELRAGELPAYFSALATERVIAAHDAATDPRTRELAIPYFAHHGITSMLDAPVRRGSELVGIVCLEHVGPLRRWTPDEQGFAGALADFMALALEAHDRRLAERTMRESETKLRAVIEHSADAIAIKDLEGRYLLANQAMADLHGRPLGELIGHLDRELIEPETLSRLAAIDAQVVSTGEPMTCELAFKGVGGRVRTFSLAKFPYRAADGRIIGTVGVGRDISEWKQAQAELARHDAELQKSRELAALKDQFLSSISHEMKTPLSLIMGYAELIQEQCPSEDLISGLMDGSRRLSEHINRLLDYSALLSGSLPLFKTEVYLPEIVSNVRGLLEDETVFQDKGLHLETSIAADTPPVLADSRRIVQLLMELLDNATAVSPPSGTIYLNVAPAGNEVRIDITDEGPGIPSEMIPRIWEAFTQLPRQEVEWRGGLGLGLTIAKKLIELHGGRVEVETELGRGSHFSIFLPAVQEAL